MTDADASDISARAVLWDVDGTLVDSAEYHWLTWRAALARENFALTRAQFESTFGQRNDTILRGYFGADFSTQEIERIAEIKETLYRELIRTRGIEPLPGVREWLARLQADGWQQCVASSAPRANIEAIMSVLGIENYFLAFASAEEVARGKPHPDIFWLPRAKLLCCRDAQSSLKMRPPVSKAHVARAVAPSACSRRTRRSRQTSSSRRSQSCRRMPSNGSCPPPFDARRAAERRYEVVFSFQMIRKLKTKKLKTEN